MNIWLFQGFILAACVLAAVGGWSARDLLRAKPRESLRGWLGVGVSLAGLAMLATLFLVLSAS